MILMIISNSLQFVLVVKLNKVVILKISFFFIRIIFVIKLFVTYRWYRVIIGSLKFNILYTCFGVTFLNHN